MDFLYFCFYFRLLTQKAECILSNLYPRDSGSESPNPSTIFYLRKIGMESFSELVNLVGRPFKWAQKLSGLRFPDIDMGSTEDVSMVCVLFFILYTVCVHLLFSRFMFI